ncbi:MAG: DUF4358 domain-containing protein [Eubacteriales bacterium]|jgi:hypothetical protein
MKFVRTLTALLTMSALVFSLTACGGGSDSQKIDLDAANTAIAALTKEDGSPLFDQLALADSDTLTQVYGLDASLLQEYAAGFSAGGDGLYLILLPNEGSENDVKNQVKTLLDTQAQQAELYYPETKAIIDDATETIIGDYLVYVASNDNGAVTDAIEGAAQ